MKRPVLIVVRVKIHDYTFPREVADYATIRSLIKCSPSPKLAMATPGILMRFVERETASDKSPQIPNTETIYNLVANDEKTPLHNTLYFLSDITPLLESEFPFRADVEANGSGEKPNSSISWVVCSLINGRNSSSGGMGKVNNAPPEAPAQGSTLVVNGNTPRTGKEQDYHDWYDQEHGEALTKVPGWNVCRRYQLVKVYKDDDSKEVETATFYGFNFYDETNGLGGPEWKAGTNTEWTFRIRGNAAKPNLRRVWKVVSA